ncbi:hypothetical protein KKE60_06805 [Patescibacteria group bacterium]|nr:hypothetical protein [Patescibacteria group bacterium]
MIKYIDVKLLTNGPNGGYRIGQVVKVDPARAYAWIQRGDAEIYVGETEKSIAQMDDIETATKPRRRKK